MLFGELPGTIRRNGMWKRSVFTNAFYEQFRNSKWEKATLKVCLSAHKWNIESFDDSNQWGSYSPL